MRVIASQGQPWGEGRAEGEAEGDGLREGRKRGRHGVNRVADRCETSSGEKIES
jgi:hypothetical protein